MEKKTHKQHEKDSIQSLINQIDITKLNTEIWGYEIEIELLGQDISVDISFEKDTMKPSEFEMLKSVLNNLETQEKKNRLLIKEDFNEEVYGSTKQYITSHVEASEYELKEIIDVQDTTKSTEEKFLEKLQLKRIGIYPEQTESEYAVWDYTLGLSDDLLVLYFNEKEELISIGIES